MKLLPPPQGYRHLETMDFVRNRRQMLIVNGLALAVAVPMLLWALIAHPPVITWAGVRAYWWLAPVTLIMNAADILLHEATHGIFMRLLSGVRPSYGLRLPYAYAGSGAWFTRLQHNIVALAPVLIWGAALLTLQAALPEIWFWAVFITQVSNVSGSMGDIYCVAHLARLPRDIRIQDTGTRMRIYAPIKERK